MMKKRIKWHIETWEINKLKPYDKNPRIISPEKLKELQRSFDDIGFAQPININTDGTILSGHARYLQLCSEGAETVDVYVPDRQLTPKQEEAVIIRMNKNIAGEWDFDILKNDFDVDDLADWGFSSEELFGFNNTGIIDEVNKGDENDEWVDSDLPEFKEGEKYIRVILHFKTELERETYIAQKNIHIDMKKKLVWISHI